MIALAASLLALAVTVTYSPVLRSDFVNTDDGLYVTENRHVQAGLTAEGIRWAFTDGESGLWIPLAWVSHMIDCEVWGLNPAGHHLTSLLLHAANGLLLFALLLRMTGAAWLGALVAALFALHPLRVESVAWVSERKDVLSVFLGLLALHAYARYAGRPTVGRFLPVALGVALSVMAKPMLVTLPAVMLLLDYWPLARLRLRGERAASGTPHAPPVASTSRLIVEKLPLLVLAGASGLATFVAARGEHAMANLEAFSLEARLANAVVSYAHYLEKTFWPTNLAVYYSLPAAWPAWQVAGGALLLASVTTLAGVTARRLPYLVVGWLWFVGTLLPVIGLLQTGTQAMADRFTYFPSIGLLLALTWGGRDLAARWSVPRPLAAGIALVLSAALAGAARHQVRYWHDGYALFTHALSVTTDNWLAHDSVGDMLVKQGDVAAAIPHFEEALRLSQKYPNAHYNLGVALALEGRLDDAEAQLVEAIRLKPDFVQAHYNLGNALMRQGRDADAIGELRAALRFDPKHAEAHASLGSALERQGQVEEALSHLSEAVRLKPADPLMQYNLGVALLGRGRAEDAAARFAEAIRLKPDLAQAHYNLGAALRAQGRLAQSVEQFGIAARLDPSLRPPPPRW